MIPSSEDKQYTLMIIDDEPQNLNVLERMLRDEGQYDLVAFTDGEMALEASRAVIPDLILLDIMMPNIDGYEVCRRFKLEKQFQGVPIIFLSALNDTLDKVNAFNLGAVDYITKPLEEAEVLARVKTHLSLRDYQLDMEEQVRLRSAELFEAHRRLRVWEEAKTDWLGVLSHEMRTPLTGIFGVADYIFDELPKESSLSAFKDEYEQARSRMQKLIDDAQLLTFIDVASENYRMLPVDFKSVVEECLDSLTISNVEFELLPGVEGLGDASITAEPSLLYRAVSDLFMVASMCVPAGGRVALDAILHRDRAELILSTDGPKLSSEAIGMFFEVGGQRILLRGGGDFGLGPALAARIIDLLKGKVSVSNGSKRGVCLRVELPITKASSRVQEYICDRPEVRTIL